MHISSPMVKLCVHPRLATSCAIIKLPVWPWQPQGQKTKRRGKRRKLLFLCRTARVQSGIHEPDATCLIYTRAHTHTHTPTPASHTCVYLDAPLIVIRSINYNLTKNYSKKIAPSYLLGQVHVVLFSCNGFAINLRFFFGGGELKLTNEYI